jgi:lipid A disaccharide synthetase
MAGNSKNRFGQSLINSDTFRYTKFELDGIGGGKMKNKVYQSLVFSISI